MALYNPRNLSDAHQLECWMCELTLVMHSIVTMNLVRNTLLSAHIITGEYVRSMLYHFVISESSILLCNVLFGVHLVANFVMSRIVLVTCYFSL